MKETKSQFYHVIIEDPEYGTLHEVNLSVENIKKIASEYENSPSMLFDGPVIYPNRIKIYIYRGNEKIAKNDLSKIRDLDNVTREFINRPAERYEYRLPADLNLTKEGLFIRGQY